jgi:hypothetical protein
MNKHSSNQFQTRACRVTVILLLATAVFFTAFIVQNPPQPWGRAPSTNSPPPTPSAAERFTTLPPGSTLPSETACASRVRRSSWEPRPDNYTANHSIPTAQQIAGLASWGDPKQDSILRQITGSFTGTTDEILQWAACKWGVDEDIIRAEAVAETHWLQSGLGDWTTDRGLCPPGIWNGRGCYQSYGILQIKYIYSSTEWPMSRDDTAFSAEYAYALIRDCYEGWVSYLYNDIPLPGYPRYHASDLWGCIGRAYSGKWYDQDAIQYINIVKTHLANKIWLQPGF